MNHGDHKDETLGPKHPNFSKRGLPLTGLWAEATTKPPSSNLDASPNARVIGRFYVILCDSPNLVAEDRCGKPTSNVESEDFPNGVFSPSLFWDDHVNMVVFHGNLKSKSSDPLLIFHASGSLGAQNE